MEDVVYIHTYVRVGSFDVERIRLLSADFSVTGMRLMDVLSKVWLEE